MRWSQMDNAQRSYLITMARFRDVMVQGKVQRREPFSIAGRECPYAMAMLSAKAQDRDHDNAKRLAARLSIAAALDGFSDADLSVLATKVPAGRAYGAGELNRQRAGAMPMNYFRGTGLGG